MAGGIQARRNPKYDSERWVSFAKTSRLWHDKRSIEV
jgi:hypothetical protein